MGRDELAEDSVIEDGGGFGGIVLAYNARSQADVDAVIEEARRAGAHIPREPADMFWGGYSGVFHDLDGHTWEVAHNPHWTLGDDGSITLGSDSRSAVAAWVGGSDPSRVPPIARAGLWV